MLRIGPSDYEVKYVPELVKSGERMISCCDHACGLVEIDDCITEQEKRRGVWYAVLFILLRQAGYMNVVEMGGELEALSYGIMQVLRDNPEMRWC